MRRRLLAREHHEAGDQPARICELPTLLPGIKVNTSPTNYHPIRAMQLQRWNGKSWVLFGDVISAPEPNALRVLPSPALRERVARSAG